MLVLGVTGGVGSGKSEILNYLGKSEKVRICRADKVGADLQKKEGRAYRPIVDLFGRDILLDSGELDRQKISSIVFRDPGMLTRLNAIVHPLVEQEVRRQIALSRTEGFTLFVIESAILIEVGYKAFCDEVWFVRAPLKTRVDRLLKTRNMTEEKVRSVAENQMKEDEFIRDTDRVIDNDADLESLYRHVQKELIRLGIRI